MHSVLGAGPHLSAEKQKQLVYVAMASYYEKRFFFFFFLPLFHHAARTHTQTPLYG